ncbi:MAG: hypothetical protein ACI9WU_002201, partial [Myxococcota bacterium]
MASLRTGLAVFACCLIVLSLFAWERVAAPSPHFHFVDLAASFLDGRLDTDTPRKSVASVQKDSNARPGYAEAVARQTTNPDGSRRGWNDWSSYRILQMKDGERLAGVFPWKDDKGARKKEFHALDGNLYTVDCRRDVKAGCHGNRLEHLRYFVSFPPFPAVAMTPLVAVWGYHVNDVWFTLFFAALNGAILFLLLQSLATRGHSERSMRDNLWLTAMFVFGTVHFFSSVRGEVWFTAL